MAESQLPLVSILTPTANRRAFLALLIDCVWGQLYPTERIEWLILDDGEDVVEDLFVGLDFVRYIRLDKKENVGRKRNRLNREAKGDILVCMDDDDYYPRDWVVRIVRAFYEHPDMSLAGRSAGLLYDCDLDLVFKMGPFSDRHSIANSLAYRRSYAETHQFGDVTFAEESEFTTEFSEPMIQLKDSTPVLQFSHGSNTYAKRRLILRGSLGNSRCFLERVNLDELVGKDLAGRYREIGLAELPKLPDYDIVYYLGIGAPAWDPSHSNLGGSEKAVKQLSSAWASHGYRVAVFCDLEGGEFFKHDGVDYYPVEQFQASRKWPTLILWRAFGVYPMIAWGLKYERLLIDLHDSVEIPGLKHCIDRVDRVMVKSASHRDFVCGKHSIPPEKCEILMNGLEIETFSSGQGIQRSPYRLCYTSCYLRGLELLLRYFFPRLKLLVPQAELHLYYGMDEVRNEVKKAQLQMLIKNCPGVVDHGRQGIGAIALEKKRSTFHLYFSKTTGETDCIAIRESLVAGCIPIISDYGVFAERDGLHLKGDPSDPKSHEEGAAQIAQLMKQPEKIEAMRRELSQSKTIISWDEVATQWERHFAHSSCSNQER